MHFLYLFSIEFIDLVWNCIGEQKIILVKLENWKKKYTSRVKMEVLYELLFILSDYFFFKEIDRETGIQTDRHKKQRQKD